MRYNVAYNTLTFEVVALQGSRNALRRKIFAIYDTPPRYWVFYTRDVPEF